MNWISKMHSESTDVSWRRGYGSIVFLTFLGLGSIGIFTKWVKDADNYALVMDTLKVWFEVLIVGVALPHLFSVWRKRDKTQDPEPVAPAPEPQPEQPQPEPQPEPAPEPAPEPQPAPAPVSADNRLDVNLDFLRQEEGLRLKAYQCSAKVWTIGFGNTRHPDGRKVKPGDTITEDEAEAYLVDKTEKVLERLQLPAWMNRNQRTAVLSWVYNCGEGAWNKSVLKTLISTKAPEAKIRQRWTSKYLTAQGSKKPVLKGRRQREAELFFT